MTRKVNLSMTKGIFNDNIFKNNKNTINTENIPTNEYLISYS